MEEILHQLISRICQFFIRLHVLCTYYHIIYKIIIYILYMEVQDFFQCWKCVDFWLAVLSYSPNCGFASLLPAATYSHEILYGLEVFSFPALTLKGKLKSIPVSCLVHLEIRRSLELHVIRVCSEYWDLHNTKKTREPVAMPLPSTKKKQVFQAQNCKNASCKKHVTPCISKHASCDIIYSTQQLYIHHD